MAMAVPVQSLGRGMKFTGGIGFVKALLLMVWFVSTISAIFIASQSNGIYGVGEYLSDEVLIPTFALQKISLDVIERGSVYVSNGTPILSFWNMLKIYGKILYYLLSIYVWIRFLKIIALVTVVGNKGEVVSLWAATIILFFLLQLILIGFFQHEAGLEGLSIPFVAIYDFFRAIPYLLLFK